MEYLLGYICGRVDGEEGEWEGAEEGKKGRVEERGEGLPGSRLSDNIPF